MSNKKQFLILVCVFSLIAIIVGWVQLTKTETVDNVIDFTICNYLENGTTTELWQKTDNVVGGIVTAYIGIGENVELPYTYKISDGRAVFGYTYKVLALAPNAFREDNTIKRLAISTYVEKIYDGAFNNLGKLEILILRSSTPPKISVAELNKLTALKEIYLYKSFVDNYKDDAVWGQFSSKFQIV